MKLVSFRHNGSISTGILEGDEIVGTGDGSAVPDMLDIIRGGEEALARLRDRVAVAGFESRFKSSAITFLPPIPAPGKILCLGLNYAEHVAEGGYDRADWPAIFLRCARSLTAHEAEIVRPSVSEQLDFEAELAVIVGKEIRHATDDEALDSVFGYACFNDGSVRDYQRKTIQWTMGKNFESTGSFGPAIVTADALPRGGAGLAISCRLNGELVQNANTSQMIFQVGETLRLLSECVTLDPGDVVVMGTPSGVGHARRPPLWMQPGDVVEVEIEGIGVLRNVIKAETPLTSAGS